MRLKASYAPVAIVCLFSLLAAAAEGDIVVLDSEAAVVADASARASERSAVLVRWSELAQRMANGTVDEASVRLCWQRMAPPLIALAQSCRQSPDSPEAERGLQLALAALAQCQTIDEPLAREAALKCIDAIRISFEGERRAAFWVIARFGLADETSVRELALRCLTEAPKGQDAEAILRLYPGDSAVRDTVLAWCSAEPIGRWGLDRQRLAQRLGIPAGQKQDAVTAAVVATLLDQDGHAHLWLPFLVLTRADDFGGMLDEAHALQLQNVVERGRPLPRRVALWLMMLQAKPRLSLQPGTLEALTTACIADGTPTRHSEKDRIIDRLHDLLLVAWLPEATSSKGAREAVDRALSGPDNGGGSGKRLAQEVALGSLAMALATDRVARARQLIGSFSAGDVGRTPLGRLAQTGYGKALFASVPGPHDDGQPPEQALEQLARMDEKGGRPRGVMQLWSLFPQWSDGPREASQVLTSEDAQQRSYAIDLVLQMSSQGMLVHPLADELALALRAIATTDANDDQTRATAMLILARSGVTAPDLVDLAASRGQQGVGVRPWVTWIDALALMAPTHVLLTEVRAALVASKAHPCTLWLYDTAVLRRGNTTMPPWDAILRAADVDMIVDKLPAYARMVARPLAEARSPEWLAGYWAAGLDRPEHTADLHCILALLGAVDAAAYHLAAAQSAE
ncbi:MAG: hypothetical protein H0X45_01575 [Planctomycetes bacterium]|nr:hypothetical protein [Planctomycetota bacterium]